MVGQQLASKRMYEQSAEFFLLARETSGLESNYSLELARVYGLLNNKEKMVEEYLNYAKVNRQNTAYIKNIFQNLLREDEDLTYLENALIRKIQQNPNERTFADLMIWLELQRKNFYGAFIQARALDKREETNGSQTMNVGRIAMDNGSWDDAITIFEYLTKNFPQANQQAFFRKMLIEAKEGKVKNTFPVDKQQIRNLSREYSRLYEEIGPNNYTFEALRNMAHLHAFYLGEIDTAAIVLRHLISSPRVSRNLVSQSKMDLGDIYILRDQPWEATLLYSQVEKAHRDSPLAYKAKLKNARLHYFTGNFSLAKSHLDILKRATTREIANDAIDLTVLITDNTYLDSTDVIMQTYAAVDLMIFQNQFRRAQRALQGMLVKYPRHSIVDEVYWQLSKIHLQAGEYQEAADYLQKIKTEFSYDILSDDAAFKLAEITERYLNDPVEAQNLYKDFLIKYPGSMYTSEARKRYRQLRGDFDS
jgi:tetratricopeptide (TPR) repeat protein